MMLRKSSLYIAFTDKEASASILNIEPFELEQDGRENFDVKQKICWLGATSNLLSAVC
jgi:hypothetical protein